MLEALQVIATALGTITIVGGSAVGLAYLAFRMFGEKWISGQFDKQLEKFKHEQEKEMAQVRYRIDSYFDRTVRLHQAEFEVLPEIWSRLHEAFYGTRSFVSWITQEHDLDRMNAAHLAEFVEKSPLMGWQKAELLVAKSKSDYYLKAISFHRLQATKKSYYDFNGYLMKKGVFIPPGVEAKFNAISTMIWDAIVEKEVHEEVKGTGSRPLQHEKRDILNADGEALMADLRVIVQSTLRDSKALLGG